MVRAYRQFGEVSGTRLNSHELRAALGRLFFFLVPTLKNFPFGCSKRALQINPIFTMTQVGQNWNQLIGGLNGWLLFGRDLEAQQR